MKEYSFSDFFNDQTTFESIITTAKELYEKVLDIAKHRNSISLYEMKQLCNKRTYYEDTVVGFVWADDLDREKVFEYCKAIIEDRI